MPEDYCLYRFVHCKIFVGYLCQSFYFLHTMINYRSPYSEPFLELLICICEMNIDIFLEYSIGRTSEMLLFNFSSFWFWFCSCFSYQMLYFLLTFCVLACDAGSYVSFDYVKLSIAWRIFLEVGRLHLSSWCCPRTLNNIWAPVKYCNIPIVLPRTVSSSEPSE